MMSLLERSRILGFGLLVITFVAGGLSGAAVERVLGAGEPDQAQPRPDRGDDRRHYIIDQVEMAPEQRATIEAIMVERSERMRAVWREVAPRLDAITDSAKADILEVLTPEQRAEYEQKLQERLDRRGGRERAKDPSPEPDDSTGAPAGQPAG